MNTAGDEAGKETYTRRTGLVSNSAVKALYTKQVIPRFKGNKLIEALPECMSDEDIVQTLQLLPDFDLSQRNWPTHIRIQQLKTLGKFMGPLSLHIRLCRHVDSTLREGFVGRRPRDKKFVEMAQAIYRSQKAGKGFNQDHNTTQITETAALLGASGMGKTVTLKRWLAHYPQVIYHKATDTHQITYIHIDMAQHGDSVKALCVAIIVEIDRLLPDHGYVAKYLKSLRNVGSNNLIPIVKLLFLTHHVGILIVDEVQRLANNPKTAQAAIDQLLTLCNTVQVPMLFVGTPKAARVLGPDLAQGRRSIGPEWGPLPRYDKHDPTALAPNQEPPCEWADFVTLFWDYQWLQPLELTSALLDRVYWWTQGIIDLAIKLFALAQTRALLQGDEQLSESHLSAVYEEDFRLLHPVLDAMRKSDLKALSKMEELNVHDLTSMVDTLVAKAQALGARRTFSKVGEASFKTQLSAALMAVGMDQTMATNLAREIEAGGKHKDTLEGLKAAANLVKPPLKTSRRSKLPAQKLTSEPTPPDVPDLSDRPKDYRRATLLAWEEKSSVFSAFDKLGMAKDVRELISLG